MTPSSAARIQDRSRNGPVAPAPAHRIHVMGLLIDAGTEQQVVTHVARSAAGGSGGVVLTTNLHYMRSFRKTTALRPFFSDAEVIVADGMPLVWASRIIGQPLPQRVTGSSLIWSLSHAAAEARVPVYLLGGNPGTAAESARVLVDRFPRLIVAGTGCPAHGFEADAQSLDQIASAVRASGAKIVFTGLPLVKQLGLLARVRERLRDVWFVGVGVSFSFVSGEVDRAPRWMQDAGLEWAHRLSQEPRRLARRYLLDGVPFALQLLGWSALTRLRGRSPHGLGDTPHAALHAVPQQLHLGAGRSRHSRSLASR